MDYYKLYMQKEADGAPLVETISNFDIYAMGVPFKIAGDVKDLTSRDWHDEDGDDEYVPSVLKMKSYEMDVKLCCKGDKFTSNAKIKALVDYLLGKDGNGAEMKIYCDYTKIGRRGVRFSALKDDASLVRSDDGDILVFTITLKVNDPVTDITLKGTSLETE